MKLHKEGVMHLAALILAYPRSGLRGFLCGVLCFGILGGPAVAHAKGPVRANWFPDRPDTPHFAWTFKPCESCKTLEPKPEWTAMAVLAGLEDIRFLLAPDEENGPAYSYAPHAIVLAPSALKLKSCQLAFLVGHEMVHVAQRHFDEDAATLSVLSGKPATWTTDGEEAMSLLEGNFPLALRMSEIWQQQEREADWIGALLAANACGCSLEDSALSYFRADVGYGGGVAVSHDVSAERAHFLQPFAESAKRLAARAY
jgi:Peptidase family M48